MSVILQDLRKDYILPHGGRVPVLDIPHLQLGTGERVALTGPSGAGKSTLLHLIAGTLLPDAGHILHGWGGRQLAFESQSEASRDRYRGRHFGCIFQGSHLLASLSARDNVLLGLAVTGRTVDRAWADHLLEAVGLRDRLHHLPHQLSPGQRLRVACARALAGRPQLLLADEPTASLDADYAAQVLEVLLALAGELQACVLVITHDPVVAKRVGRELPLASINRRPPC